MRLRVRRVRLRRVIVAPGLVVAVMTLTTIGGTIASSGVAATSLASFSSHVSTIDAAQLGGTWRRGCPVGPAQLRLVTMDYVNFQGEARVGTMVVAAKVVGAVVTIFRTLYVHRVPIRWARSTLDGGRQHLGLQLSACGCERAATVVGARVR